MFQILNENEVRLMGRVYNYEGDKLMYSNGDLVENQAVLRQFRSIHGDGWMDVILDMVSDKRDVIMDRWEYAIRKAVKVFPDGFRLSQLLYPVCIELGSTEDEAKSGITYHPYSGKQITNTLGWIATWIEERSPDSRQRYFCAGKRWAATNRPLLFVNDGLYEKNTACNWCPYTHVRGTIWRMDSAAAEARQQPDEETLNAAALLYKKQGMRGARNRIPCTQNFAVTERIANIPGIATGFMATLGIVAAIAPHA